MTHIFAYNNGEGKFYNSNIDKVDKRAFSGDNVHANKEEFMNLKNKGPIPIGTYTVSYIDKSDQIGHLTPQEGTEVYEREEMLIHLSNSISNHNSHGCIIVSSLMFENINADDTIEVTNEMY